MKRFPAHLAVLVAAILVPSSLFPPLRTAAAATSPGRISGVVRDEAGAVLAGAAVRLSTPSGPVAGDAVTDGDGRYAISVAAGLYDITVAVTDAAGPWTALVKNMPVWSDTPLDLAVVRPADLEPAEHADPASAFGAPGAGTENDAGTGPEGGGPEGSAGGTVTWQGRIIGPDGTPVEPRSFRLDPAPGAPTGTLDSGPGGAFTFTGPPGRYALALEAPLDPWAGRGGDDAPPGGLFLAGSVDLTADRSADLELPPAGAVDVVVAEMTDGSKRSQPLAYEAAAAARPANLGPGVTARVTIRATIAADGTHYHPLLAGPSALTFTVPADPAPRLVTAPARPGDRLAIVVGDRRTPPGAPRGVSATAGAGAGAGAGKAKVTWAPPAADGGSPVTAYVVTASHGHSNHRATFGATARAGTIRNLVDGDAYTITVTARNAKGSGPASTPVAVVLDGDGEQPLPPSGGGERPGPGGDPLGGAGSTDDGPATPRPGSGRTGYWLLGADGAVYAFGDAAPLGDASASLASSGNGTGRPARRAVDIEVAPSGRGYWVLDDRGRVHPFGDGPHLGDVPPDRLDPGEAPASLSATPTGAGYWVFTTRGRAIAFGDAVDLDGLTNRKLNGPVVDSVATPSGRGYYMVAADGGIFAFGDARFAGSMGGRPLNAPVRAVVPDGDGRGYWLVAGDGGVFAFDAPFQGSMGGQRLNRPVRGMVRYGDGYVMVGEDGGIFTFSDRPYTGSLGARPPASPVVAVAALG